MSSASGGLRPLYRIRQFLSSLRPRISEGERGQAAEFLHGRLLRLFESMTPRDRRHCLDVFLALRRQGCRDEAVLTAALLHDAGKGPGIRVWHRVLYVLMEAVASGRLERLAEEGGSGWRGALAAILRHPERGAELAADAGASAAAVRLIREHEERGAAQGDERLALLRAADDSC
ncbi:MAG: HD domain-containing protein [Chloroflexi bacterium]|nr:HD domain-containing protein [Chloroflexota bacterium]